MKCPHCQAENRESAEFCADCGQPLRSETTCSQCGNVNPPDKRFCDKCGHSLAEKAHEHPKAFTPACLLRRRPLASFSN
jgi:predicted amidophosphoribosyltransferase